MITITDIAYSVPKLTGCVERFIQSWYCPCYSPIKFGIMVDTQEYLWYFATFKQK